LITEKCQFQTEKCQFQTEKCQFQTEKSRLAQLKAWMKKRGFDPERQRQIMLHFTAQNQVGVRHGTNPFDTHRGLFTPL
jgi:hypothetical protein